MKTVSFQGLQLTPGQVRQRDFALKVRRSLSSTPLNQLIKEIESRSLSENFDDQYKFRLDYSKKGTPWLGDVFGF
jgi:hypothetical protein